MFKIGLLSFILLTIFTSMAAAQRGLLVGVSDYPDLGDAYSLYGPDNDIHLLAEVLSTRYDFHPESIEVLSNGNGKVDRTRLPTRGNIEQAFRRLANSSIAGEQVVIFLAGHGSQQPEFSDGDPEVDGLDEIFLPGDVGRYDERLKRVPNAIVDDEIAKWVQAILAKGTRVWLIFDCCHAGDMSRGVRERTRSVDPTDKEGLAIPSDAMRAARQRAAQRNVVDSKSGNNIEAGELPLAALCEKHLVVTYACQSHEKAIELSVNGKPYGLLSFALNSVITKSTRPLSYRELSHQTYREYVALGRSAGPTPLVEGDVDRAILGYDKIETAPIHVAVNSDDQTILNIDAGRLRGISKNSTLAVYSGTGDQRILIGHARVKDVAIASATAVSCEFGGLEAKSFESLDGAHCEVIETDYGGQTLSVAVTPIDARGATVPEERVKQLKEFASALASRNQSMISHMSDPSAARWLLRWADDKMQLVPFETDSTSSEPPITSRQSFGPFAPDEGGIEKAVIVLNQIARAENLLRIAALSQGDPKVEQRGSPQMRIEATTKARGKSEAHGEATKVEPGDEIELVVTNTGDADLDLTVLFVNSRMGITPVYPSQSHVNRLRPGQVRRLPEIEFTSGPLGRAHFVFAALAAKGQPRDFTWLAQNSIPATRKHTTKLDELFEFAMFGEGKTRSISSNVDCVFDILPIDIGH